MSNYVFICLAIYNRVDNVQSASYFPKVNPFSLKQYPIYYIYVHVRVYFEIRTS